MKSNFFRFLSLLVLALASLLWLDASSARGNDPDLKEGFANPPAEYGEVPFWWWTGEKLDVERLNWELDQLAKVGIPGAQINYAHQDVRNEKQPNWLTYPNEPEVFADEWFDVFEKVAAHCRELNMGVGLSGYTLDWQNSPGNLFDRLLYRDKELQSQNLYVRGKKSRSANQKFSELVSEADLASDDNDAFVQIVFYPVDSDGVLCTDRFKLVDPNALDDSNSNEPGELWIYAAKRSPNTLNPLCPKSGKEVVERFFQPFETRAIKSLDGKDDGTSTLGLNYFFQDELQLGTGETVWWEDLPSEFEKRKGESFWTAAPAMFGGNVDPRAEKYRLDYMDVRVELAEERYFMPIYEWNAKRGRIYACDPGSRGRDPSEFCDYFSAVRWYTAPGHDTPGGRADFIKNKVSSSIAHFYNRPRVWLEGYHSFGWGADPKRLLFATNENYLFGANLLNLHGLYYTTYGGYWEWAPPCYHFRQPYWETFGTFLKYFQRLSFALTRGVEQTDVVVLYPVSSYHAKLDGPRARDVAFEAATRVFASGRDVLFIDDESIQRAEVKDGKLCVANGEHSVLVLPSTKGIHWKTLEKARELYRSGGVVIALDALPIASDRAGRDDPKLDEVVREIFGGSATELKETRIQREPGVGIGAFFSSSASPTARDDGDKTGSNNSISKLREYPGGFKGHWVWSPNLAKEISLKWIANGLTDDEKEYRARFFCDNSGSLFVNGNKICENADYSDGWEGALTLKNGDVVAIRGVDADSPRRGSAGLFFALVDRDKTVATAEDFRCFDGAPSDERWNRDERYEPSDKWLSVDVGNVHVLHRTGVNSEASGVSASPSGRDDARMWADFRRLIDELPRDVFDALTDSPCSVMKRTTEDADVYFVMKAKKNSLVAFRSLGRPEFLDCWNGERREPSIVARPTEGALNGTTVVQWPCDETDAGLIVFWKNEKSSRVASSIRELQESLVPTETTVASTLDGDWGFELLPTLDNQWGDFRLPISEKFLGAEAQRVEVEGVGEFLCDFGRKFWKLGPFPKDADLSELESTLANLKSIDPSAPIAFGGKEFAWRPYSFSWRWGIEGNPGRQGYHGLKEKIDSRFIGLGANKEAHNETIFAEEEGGSVYFLWSTIPVETESDSNGEIVDVFASGGVPTSIYVGGKPFRSGESRLTRSKSRREPVLLRYDAPGRYACAFVRRASDDRSASRLEALDGLDSGAFNGLSTGLREETPNFIEDRVPLSTIWFNMPGVLNYDPIASDENAEQGDSDDPVSTALKGAQIVSFVAPPGLKELQIASFGPIWSTTINGETADCEKESKLLAGRAFWKGDRETFLTEIDREFGSGVDEPVFWTTIRLKNAVERESRVRIGLGVPDGFKDGAAFPEPIRLTCERGIATLGNWNERGVLANYSGGARYSKTFQWDLANSTNARVLLNLGKVGASCRVRLNGQILGDLPTPRELDVSDFLKRGENLLEIDVYNTLSNFYENIPSRYKNRTDSGLIGPVELKVKAPVKTAN
ncbi:MAG: hypothetical protein IJM30_11105 [Thermoguttaceae bacterium]|nr:hypothetical protein [Thermoguttaceae bacterium]